MEPAFIYKIKLIGQIIDPPVHEFNSIIEKTWEIWIKYYNINQITKLNDESSWFWRFLIKDGEYNFKINLLLNYRQHQSHRIQSIYTYKIDRQLSEDQLNKVNSLIDELNQIQADWVFTLKEKHSNCRWNIYWWVFTY